MEQPHFSCPGIPGPGNGCNCINICSLYRKSFTSHADLLFGFISISLLPVWDVMRIFNQAPTYWCNFSLVPGCQLTLKNWPTSDIGCGYSPRAVVCSRPIWAIWLVSMHKSGMVFLLWDSLSSFDFDPMCIWVVDKKHSQGMIDI